MIATFTLMLALAAQAQPTTIPEMWDAWCARCHAQDGSGQVADPTITVEPLDFTDCAVASPEPDADWELAITAGGPAVGLSAEMPGFGDSITAEQARGFVAHMRSFCREAGWPHGNTNFPRPIFAEKAFPENELVILPAVSHLSTVASLDVVAVYERRFGKRSMWEVSVPVASHATTDRVRRQGLGDVALAIKHVLFARAHAPAILSAGLEVALPTGSEGRGLGRGTTMFEPYLAAGAVIANSYLQAQAKLELPADRAKASRAFVYHLYAGRDLSESPDTWTIGVELNGEDEQLAFTPQLRKGLTKTGALGAAVGVRIPITERRGQRARLVSYLLWEYLEPVRARR